MIIAEKVLHAYNDKKDALYPDDYSLIEYLEENNVEHKYIVTSDQADEFMFNDNSRIIIKDLDIDVYI